MRRILLILVLTLAGLVSAPRRARAQQPTRADSASILLEAARRLDLEGRRAAATAVLDLITRQFSGTPAAAQARTMLTARPAEAEGSGRLELLGWGLVDGAWLGVAIPAAFGADNANIYGVGLIVGAPAGLMAAKWYVDRYRPTLGQARAITFAFRWGTWQAAGWYGTLTNSSSAEAVFRTLVAGGLGGATAAALYTRHRAVSAGRVAAASHGSNWGTWFGAVAVTILDIGGNGGTQFVLASGDAGLIGGVVLSPRDVTTGQVWMTSAGGLAGLAIGLGLDILVKPDNDKTGIAIPGVTSALGLLYGARMARRAEPDQGGETEERGAPGEALLEWDGSGARLGAPALRPTLVPVGERGARRLYRPALAVPLVHVTF